MAFNQRDFRKYKSKAVRLRLEYDVKVLTVSCLCRDKF
jgi:hypothetical protein